MDSDLKIYSCLILKWIGKPTSWRGEPPYTPGLRHVAAGQRRGTWWRCAWEHSPCGWPHHDRWTDQLGQEKDIAMLGLHVQGMVLFMPLEVWEEAACFCRMPPRCQVKKCPERTTLSYLLEAGWPVSEESEPGGRPAPVLEVLQQSAPRYDTPGTYSHAHFIHCDHTLNVPKLLRAL